MGVGKTGKGPKKKKFRKNMQKKVDIISVMYNNSKKTPYASSGTKRKITSKKKRHRNPCIQTTLRRV
jgi:hypothetical protein